MLDALRRGAASWVARIFLGILVVSFGIWGIGDIFRNFNREIFAQIGSTQISADNFRLAYDRERQLLSRQSGRAVSNEQARALNLHGQLAQRMVTEAVLDEQAHRLTLGVSQTGLAHAILDDPIFVPPGASGFSRPYFEQLLRENGLTEATYVAQRRQLTLRRQIAEALTGHMQVPAVYGDIINRFTNERRSAIYFTLPRDQFGQVDAPDEKTLETYYQVVHAAFRTAPRRTAEILLMDINELEKSVIVSDKDARAIYDSNPGRFGEVEKRRIFQWSFASKEEAAAALAKLNEGQDFEALAEASGKKLADIDLGVVNAQGIVDPAVRKAAFSLPAGGHSEVVEGSFGAVLIAAKSIEPASVKDFGAVEADIKKELAQERARKNMLDLVDKVEDERSGGAHLGEIAGKYQLTFRTLTAIDRNGLDQGGQDLGAQAGGRQVIDAIFRNGPGSEPDPIRLADGGQVWFDVREVIADRERQLTEVREEVMARWMEEKERAALLAKADEAIAKIRAGKSIDEAAAELGLQTRQSALVTRNGSLAEFSRGGAEEFFRVSKGAAGTAIAENGVDRVVFVINEVEGPAAGTAADKRVIDDVNESVKNDVLSAYVAELQKEIGVTINRGLVERLAAGGS